ncbi:MAG: hypothetical protein U0Z44_14985 [Kouleothrix sp.]
MTTAITFNPLQHTHDDPTHVERMTRLQAITASRLPRARAARRSARSLPATPADDQQILRSTRAPWLLEAVALGRHSGWRPVWYGHHTTRGTFAAAQMSAGAAITAVDAVVSGRAANGLRWRGRRGTTLRHRSRWASASSTMSQSPHARPC